MGEYKILGVDIGGSGIKGGIVNVLTGELLTERLRIPTPSPSDPTNVAKTFVELVEKHNWNGPVGCGFPAIVKDGVSLTATNVHDDWMGTNIEKVLRKASGCPIKALNDADAAGIAEMRFGAGLGQRGTVVVLTIGTGIGSAIFLDGKLLTNTELGHVFLRGQNEIAERYVSNGTRKRLDLSWEEWAPRFKYYLEHIEYVFSPNLIIIGGGASKRFNRFKDLIKINTKVVPAELLNNSGTIGAACYAYEEIGNLV